MAGALPFPEDVTIEHSGVEEPVETTAALWQIEGNARTPGGEAYDWQGEAPLDVAAHLVDVANPIVNHGARRLRVVLAVANEYVPHIALRLREIRPGG